MPKRPGQNRNNKTVNKNGPARPAFQRRQTGRGFCLQPERQEKAEPSFVSGSFLAENKFHRAMVTAENIGADFGGNQAILQPV